jgi:glycosyltransferase involved in cell wall biosynthesis
MVNPSLDSTVPFIEPVPEDTERPFWSVMIPTYNCAHYLRQTLDSVLSQDLGPEQMQIAVVDDHSTQDDPRLVVEEMGKGRVQFYRQSQNIGAQANFTSCIENSRGQWVHILHGDDAVKLGFYKLFYQVIQQHPELGAVFCDPVFIDEDGNLKTTGISSLELEPSGCPNNWLKRIATQSLIRTPTIVVKRDVYEAIGGFHPQLFHAADWEMWIRISAHYPVWYVSNALAYYREHSHSDTSRLERSGQGVADSRKAVEIANAYLPIDRAREILFEAKKRLAMDSVTRAKRFIKQDDFEAAQAQIREAILCCHDAEISQSASKLMFNLGLRHEAIRYAWYALQHKPYDLQGWKCMARATLKPL